MNRERMFYRAENKRKDADSDYVPDNSKRLKTSYEVLQAWASCNVDFSMRINSWKLPRAGGLSPDNDGVLTWHGIPVAEHTASYGVRIFKNTEKAIYHIENQLVEILERNGWAEDTAYTPIAKSADEIIEELLPIDVPEAGVAPEKKKSEMNLEETIADIFG